jgi:ATP-binding cassette, subfamily B, bacterial
LFALLQRFYDPQDGRILIDGQDIARVTQESLRESIGIVPQDIALFHRSVLENIRYGKPDATDDQVLEAAITARCDFIKDLPNGLHTIVGDRGVKLSGGQRQRIAIARAILADPRILILDDATSSVDSSTEQEIKTALGAVLAGRTTFVIAHRLSTIALAHRILVLEDGELVADGSHAELLESSDLYREIVEKGMPDQVFLTRKPAEVAGA